MLIYASVKLSLMLSLPSFMAFLPCLFYFQDCFEAQAVWQGQGAPEDQEAQDGAR